MNKRYEVQISYVIKVETENVFYAIRSGNDAIRFGTYSSPIEPLYPNVRVDAVEEIETKTETQPALAESSEEIKPVAIIDPAPVSTDDDIDDLTF